jgi:hypothetical protein
MPTGAERAALAEAIAALELREPVLVKSAPSEVAA